MYRLNATLSLRNYMLARSKLQCIIIQKYCNELFVAKHPNRVICGNI